MLRESNLPLVHPNKSSSKPNSHHLISSFNTSHTQSLFQSSFSSHSYKPAPPRNPLLKPRKFNIIEHSAKERYFRNNPQYLPGNEQMLKNTPSPNSALKTLLMLNDEPEVSIQPQAKKKQVASRTRANTVATGLGPPPLQDLLGLDHKIASLPHHDDIPDAEMAAYKEAFKFFDRDGNGSIDQEELRIALSAMQENITEEELDMMIRNIDFNNTGQVDFQEFLTVMSTSRPLKQETEKELEAELSQDIRNSTITTQRVGDLKEIKLEEAFKAMDIDKNGFISPADLRAVFDGLGDKSLTEQQILEMIRDADTDGDGQVCFKDFVQMMTAHQK